MRVVVAMGGSVLAPDLEADRVQRHAAAVEELLDDGHEVGVVVGGGGVAREYIGTARELDANEIALDELGIAVTRLNARLLIAALGEDAVSTPPEAYATAGDAMRRDETVVMGGVVAGQTTDAVGAALAEYVGADLLVYATSVPGVFDADPETDPTAERFDRLTAAELVDVVAGLEMDAGSSAPVDLLAAKLIQRAGIRAIVIDGTDPGTVVDAVRGDGVEGTEIRPDGGVP